MKVIEIIKDVVLFGGNLPPSKTKEVRDYLEYIEDEQYFSKSVATKYAEFCVTCDREKLPLLCIDDYIDQYC